MLVWNGLLRLRGFAAVQLPHMSAHARGLPNRAPHCLLAGLQIFVSGCDSNQQPSCPFLTDRRSSHIDVVLMDR